MTRPAYETRASAHARTARRVVVIGAGPCGAAAALAAVRAGARVLLVDRAEFPRAKVCGSCLAAEGTRIIEALGAASAITQAVPLGSVRVSCGGRSLVIPRTAGVAIARPQLDAALVEAARCAGAEVRLATSARILKDGRIGLHGRDGEDTTRADAMVVADGLAGTALDGLDAFPWRIARRSHMGLGGIARAGTVACGPGEIRMRVGRGGYIGAVRLAGGELDVAAAVDPALVRAQGSAAACVLALLGEDALDRSALASTRWRGTPLLTRRRARIASEGILVAGDAAGYMEPFTGEGMSWALATGAAAGMLAATSREAHRAWPAVHARLTRAPRLRCRLLAGALRRPALVEALLAAGSMAPQPFAWLAAAIGGRDPRAMLGEGDA